jgi:predicted outer membrane repeat protein
MGSLGAASADTSVCGTIAGQHWTIAGSPYRVTCNINVALLTIDLGVTVLFQSNYLFEVDGFLTASGTLAQPIIFTRTNGGGWNGIFFNYCENGSEMDYCNISAVQGGSAISCITANPVLRSCVVFNNASSGEAGGLYVDNRSYPGSEMLVQSCTFSNNTSAFHGGAVSAHTGTNEIRFVSCSFIPESGVRCQCCGQKRPEVGVFS